MSAAAVVSVPSREASTALGRPPTIGSGTPACEVNAFAETVHLRLLVPHEALQRKVEGTALFRQHSIRLETVSERPEWTSSPKISSPSSDRGSTLFISEGALS
jgi:hypothetical protein